MHTRIEKADSNDARSLGIGALGLSARPYEEQLSASPSVVDATFLAGLLDTVRQAVVVIDLSGTISYWNRFAEDLYGWTSEEVIGRQVLDVIPGNTDREHAPAIMAHIAAGESWSGTLLVRRRDGSSFWADVNDSPILTDDGTLIGIIRTSIDVTARQHAAAVLTEAEERFRSLVEHLPLTTYMEQLGTGLVYCSPQLEQLTGYTAEQWMFERDFWFNCVHPDDRPLMTAELAHTDATGEPFCLEHRIITRDGRVVWVRNEAVLHRDDTGVADYWRGFLLDITPQKGAEQAMRHSEERLQALVRNAIDIIGILDGEGTLIYVSPAIERVLGFAPTDMVGMPALSYIHPDDHSTIVDAFVEVAARLGATTMIEYRSRHIDGSWHLIECHLTNRLDDPVVEGLIINARDITERRHLEAEVTFRAFHDPLTNLPNRALFLDRLAHALRRSARRPLSVAVIFLDLDNFKVVNDSLGHSAGDELLIAVAARLSMMIRAFDTVARLGGDEFTILIDDVGGIGEVTQVAERVLTALRDPVILGERPFIITGSVGIALGSSNLSAEDVIRDADLAMYTAKGSGKDRIAVFDPEMHLQVLHRMELGQQLRDAIESGNLSLRYQPEITLASGTIFGAEALVRWEYASDGTLLPDEFIAVAEETGLIVPLGTWVLNQACLDTANWIETGNPPATFAVTVNLSPFQFRDAGLVAVVQAALAQAHLHPSRLILEVTESVLANDADQVVATLHQFRDAGVRIAVDDFGTGYSSLARLRHFPVDFLKIDRSFISELGHDAADMVLVRSMIELGHGLGLQVIAEGVETEAQEDVLHQLGCDVVQGYRYAKPLPGHDIALFWQPRVDS